MARYLSAFNIDPGKKLAQLSSGVRVKLSLAVALSHDAEIFLLDEPTSGLDPVVREQVLEILERLARERGACVLFSSHITQDVEKIATRILFLVDGAFALDTDAKALGERFVKLRLDGLSPRLDQVRRKGVVLNGGFGIMKASDAASAGLDKLERAPLRVEDVLIFLEGGVGDAPAD